MAWLPGFGADVKWQFKVWNRIQISDCAFMLVEKDTCKNVADEIS